MLTSSHGSALDIFTWPSRLLPAAPCRASAGVCGSVREGERGKSTGCAVSSESGRGNLAHLMCVDKIRRHIKFRKSFSELKFDVKFDENQLLFSGKTSVENFTRW